MSAIKFSKSKLDVFKRCPRCFWLDIVEGVKWPEGIKSGLPMAMDSKIKEYHDRHRAAGTLPPELAGKVPGQLFKDQKQLNRWRNWRSALTVDVDEFTLSGMFDDIFHDPGPDLYAGYDYKTKSKAPEADYSQKYYSTQAAAYDLLLNANGMKTNGDFYFSYWFPTEIRGTEQTWGIAVDRLHVDHTEVKALVIAAGRCLLGSAPKSSEDCEQCEYIRARSAVGQRLAAKTQGADNFPPVAQEPAAGKV